MEKEDAEELLKTLKGTEVLDRIIEMESIYTELAGKQDSFTERFNIHCRKGCGRCCENFYPYITENEALYLAYGMVRMGREEEVLSYESPGTMPAGCPFYDGNSPDAHCTVYPYRPLICRLFNASVVHDKNGEPVFRHCRWNVDAKDIDSREFESDMENVVSMSDYGERIEESGAESQKEEGIMEAVKEQLMRLGLLLELEKESGN